MGKSFTWTLTESLGICRADLVTTLTLPQVPSVMSTDRYTFASASQSFPTFSGLVEPPDALLEPNV